MPSSRRGLPDNLDPLVDTLSNVVGILVMVVALTQIQVGDAIDRLMAVEAAERSPSSDPVGIAEGGPGAAAASDLAQLEARRERVLARAGSTLEGSLRAAETMLARVMEMPSGERTSVDAGGEALRARILERRSELERARGSLADREAHAEALREVPRELVARLPDPEVLTGREQWIFCRHGRCYLASQAELVGAGESAIGRILVHHLDARTVRPDEYEALAHYLRKKDIGHGPFVWRFVTRPEPRARLVWTSRESGIEPSRLESSPALRRWLVARDPTKDFIRFHVWSDSFEAYLEARRIVETAGFRAGWKAYETGEELDLPVTFGSRRPAERPIEVD
ncbi:MAG: hypothetical protein ACX98W_08550 [bacterium]